MNIDLDKIGNFLFEQRNKKGLTQEQLASKIGASFKTVSKWENGGSFPDVSYQLLLCNALDITLKELQMGCLDEEERHKNKCLRIFSRFSIIFISITIPILCFLLVFFSSHVGKPKIYKIISHQSSEESGIVSGLIVESYKKNYLMINYIKLFDYEYNDYDTVSMDLYSDNVIIYHSNEIGPFNIKYEDTNAVNHRKLQLLISINGDYYSIDLEVNKNIKSTNIIKHNKYNYNAINYEMLTKLGNSGFKNTIGDIWYKSIYNNNYNIEISIYANTRRVYYSKATNDMVLELFYYKDFNSLEAVIYSNQLLNTIVEKYNYNYSNKELDCKVGLCASYQKALKDIEEYVSLLNGE